MAKTHINTDHQPGQDKLSKTEKEILNSIKQGHTSEQIAVHRECSIRTVEKHRSNIIRKLGLAGKPNTLIRWAMLEMK
ncbi:MAG: helix-turn-helix transcriptional regulator [Roseivirga sp.]|nr:helix-turn-helix transcriptional regulator [Roseivirga sp.]